MHVRLSGAKWWHLCDRRTAAPCGREPGAAAGPVPATHADHTPALWRLTVIQGAQVAGPLRCVPHCRMRWGQMAESGEKQHACALQLAVTPTAHGSRFTPLATDSGPFVQSACFGSLGSHHAGRMKVLETYHGQRGTRRGRT